MKNIFWGFFFLFVNFNLTVNGHTLNLSLIHISAQEACLSFSMISVSVMEFTLMRIRPFCRLEISWSMSCMMVDFRETGATSSS